MSALLPAAIEADYTGNHAVEGQCAQRADAALDGGRYEAKAKWEDFLIA